MVSSGRKLKEIILTIMSSIKALKDNLEKIEVSINESLSKIKERLDTLETANFASDKDVILQKITETGDNIKEANNKVAEEIKNDILQIKDIVITRLMNDNRKLRSRVSKMEMLAIETERRMNLMEQHSRKVNVEIDGIPDAIEQKDLKSYVVDIFRHAEIEPVSSEDIEVVHRLNSKRYQKRPS